jgi:hypothetical protein
VSKRDIFIYVSNYRPYHVSFSLGEGGGGERVGFLHSPSVQMTPVLLSPDEKKEFSYCVNRFLELKQQGNYNINYSFQVGYINPKGELNSSEFKTVAIQGFLLVKINEHNGGKLRKTLEQERKNLNLGAPLEQIEAAEALCYLQSPISLKFMRNIHDSNHLYSKFMAIDALRRFNNSESNKLLIEFLDNDDSFMLIDEVLKILRERKVHIEKYVIQRLLYSQNISIQYVGLKYLRKIKEREYMSIVLSMDMNGNEVMEKMVQEVIKSTVGTQGLVP